jgi:hypothetical protein
MELDSTFSQIPEIDYVSFDTFVVMVMFLSRLILITGAVTVADTFTALILDTFVVMVMFLSWLILVTGMLVVALVIFVDLVTLIFSFDVV